MEKIIISMIPQYGKLNCVYKDIVGKKELLFENQKFISDFCKHHENTEIFETSIISLICKKSACNTLLSSLKKEIEINISIYNANQPQLDCIDTQLICSNYENSFKDSINVQMEITKEYGKELTKVNSSLEAIGYRPHEKIEEKQLNTEYDICKQEYNKKKESLDELFDKKKQARQQVEHYQENRFKDIFELGGKLLDILKKYTTDASTSNNNSDTIQKNQNIYFDMGLVSNIHKVCNNMQFEAISELDLYATLNNQATSSVLKIKPNEKIRMCYLIHCLSEKIDGTDKAVWRGDMLSKLGISESYYSSKYREPVSKIPSKKDKEFATALSNKLGN